MDDPERTFVPFFSPSDDYVLLVNNMGGASTLEMYIADEALLQLSKIPSIPLKSCCILNMYIGAPVPLIIINIS